MPWPPTMADPAGYAGRSGSASRARAAHRIAGSTMSKITASDEARHVGRTGNILSGFSSCSRRMLRTKNRISESPAALPPRPAPERGLPITARPGSDEVRRRPERSRRFPNGVRTPGPGARASYRHTVRQGSSCVVGRNHFRPRTARRPSGFREFHLFRRAGALFLPGRRPDSVRKLCGLPARGTGGRISRHDCGAVAGAGDHHGHDCIHDRRSGRGAVRDRGRRARHQRHRHRRVLPHDRAFSPRQSGALHPLPGRRGIRVRHWRSRVSRRNVPDGSESGVAVRFRTSGACRALDVAPRRRLWDRALCRDEAPGQRADPAGECRGRRRCVPPNPRRFSTFPATRRESWACCSRAPRTEACGPCCSPPTCCRWIGAR